MSDRKLTRKSPAGGASSARLRNGGRPPAKGRKAVDFGVLDDHLGYFIRRLQVWVFQDFIRALASVGIRPAQYSVLVVIGANPGLSQADLAQTLGIERARLVRLLHRLQRRGLTERRAAPNDRRSHALFLTREGQAVLKKSKMLAARHEARLAASLGPEHRSLMLAVLRDWNRSLRRERVYAANSRSTAEAIRSKR
ncbi:MAG: MarR family winged helix-turn-helix transcriptional regulator [Pseudolabrys sp.]|jgi:DNA-binding MarR family transcriptional regulator